MKITPRIAAITSFLVLAGVAYFVSQNLGQGRPAQAKPAAPKIKVEIVGFVSGDGTSVGAEGLTNKPGAQIRIAVTSDKHAGNLDIIVDNTTQLIKALTNGDFQTGNATEIPFTLALDQPVTRMQAKFTPSGEDKPFFSDVFVVRLDQEGPVLQTAELIEVPGMGSALQVRFADGDFHRSSLENVQNFQVQRQRLDRKFDTAGIAIRGKPVAEGRFVKVFLPSLPAGLYRLVVKGRNQPKSAPATGKEAITFGLASSAPLKDLAGNFAGATAADPEAKDQTWEFSVIEGRKFGEHVAFPQYTPPKKVAAPKEGFNPADYVVTRVARLYYFRDAHRVAEIINRNVRSLNRAAVAQAERRAERARIDADDKRGKRQQAEREAIRAAQQARSAEAKLASARQVLAEIQALENQNANDTFTKQQLTENRPPDATDQQIAAATRRLDAQIASRNAMLETLPKKDGLQVTIGDMERSVAALRQTELDKQESSEQAQFADDRAAEEQFRQEVAAANEDPGTYVAGDVDSVDPVTQVSISVIGEGLIQLRGPIKGINKIRIMINQIDSPLGQIKIGVNTVQVNGENGQRMERVVGKIEGHIDLGRFLTSQSLMLLRQAIQSEAAQVAFAAEHGGHYQVDRDRKYLYTFFGRDFIDELYEMDSEFLHTQNKLLSLHSMDTISLNRALFILALARNDVRQRILARFMQLVQTELPQAEWDFRRSSELFPHKTRWWLSRKDHCDIDANTMEAVARNAANRYHFRNLRGFFETGLGDQDTMNPMQREFIRLTQIFKSQMVAEVEWKQRVIERGLIEDPANTDEKRSELLEPVHEQALELERDAYLNLVEAARNNQVSLILARQIVASINKITETNNRIEQLQATLKTNFFGKEDENDDNPGFSTLPKNLQKEFEEYVKTDIRPIVREMRTTLSTLQEASWTTAASREYVKEIPIYLSNLESVVQNDFDETYSRMRGIRSVLGAFNKVLNDLRVPYQEIRELLSEFTRLAESSQSDAVELKKVRDELVRRLKQLAGAPYATKILSDVESSYDANLALRQAESRILFANSIARKTRLSLNHRKLLNHLIDEKEEKYIELVEGTRAHIAAVDNYLKRLAIALEDDFKVQFYDPAFVRIRRAAMEYDVSLGQVERTTVLTNNRTFAKVTPQATMEFDLPKRQLAIEEAMEGAERLVERFGPLLNDPTYQAAFQMMGGSQSSGVVKNSYPGLPSSTDQQVMGLTPSDRPDTGSSLQGLVPDPAIYKFETGTGFELRPVIQPDGDSVVYDFNYMYTTNVREPVRADEKHLGRIKRHFVHTQVQTSSFEMREISRYQVAIKASRTSQGVPLLQDIPVLGAAFRPAASAESSLQQNIILGQSTVYPTLFDLMGLRWAPHVVELDHLSLLDNQHVAYGRRNSVGDFIFDDVSRRVDDILDIQKDNPEHYRPDLYHPHRQPSPYHPGGYRYPYRGPADDPTGSQFERIDRRPPEMRDPRFDLHRHRPVQREYIPRGATPEPVSGRRMPDGIPSRRHELVPSLQRLRAPANDGASHSSRWRNTTISHVSHLEAVDARRAPRLRPIVQTTRTQQPAGNSSFQDAPVIGQMISRLPPVE